MEVFAVLEAAVHHLRERAFMPFHVNQQLVIIGANLLLLNLIDRVNVEDVCVVSQSMHSSFKLAQPLLHEV